MSKERNIPGQPKAAAQTLRLQPVFVGSMRMAYLLGIGGWLVALIYFWSWWLGRDRVIDWPAFTVVTMTVAWITLLAVLTNFALDRLRISVFPWSNLEAR